MGKNLLFVNVSKNTKIIDTNMVSMDQEIINRLRKIGKGDEENI